MPSSGPPTAPRAKPATMPVMVPVTSIRERRPSVAKRGTSRAPAAEKIQGMAVSRPICSGLSLPYVPMMEGRK